MKNIKKLFIILFKYSLPLQLTSTALANITGEAIDCFNPELTKLGTKKLLNYKSFDLKPAWNGLKSSSSDEITSTSASFEGKNQLILLKRFQSSVIGEKISYIYFKTEYTNAGPIEYNYGHTSDLTNRGVIYTNNPYRIDKRFTLKKGESHKQNYFIISKDTDGLTKFKATDEVAYLGQVKINIAAGEYLACYFRESREVINSNNYSHGLQITNIYISTNYGIIIKTEDLNKFGKVTSGEELVRGSLVNGKDIFSLIEKSSSLEKTTPQNSPQIISNPKPLPLAPRNDELERRHTDIAIEKKKQVETSERKQFENKKEEKNVYRNTNVTQTDDLRLENLNRMQSLATPSNDYNGTALTQKSSNPSASYAARLVGSIKPNITKPDDLVGNPRVEIEVKVNADGTIISRRLAQASGNLAWDNAMLSAIDKTKVFPKDIDGRVPPVILLGFRPFD